jgi:uncharacterized membrane protein YbhN (UPF0104 family)
MGTGAFVDGLRSVDAEALVAAVVIGALTTACCAWRWSLIARRLGVAVPLGTAVTAYYGSQFLNTTMPGGVLGDVHRGARHGRAAGNLPLGLRAVAWERVAGQVVQAAIALVVLSLVPSPVHSSMPVVAAAALVGLTALALVAVVARGSLPSGDPSPWRRSLSAAAGDVREGLLARGAWLGVLAASGLAVAGHLTTFLIAVRSTGLTVSPVRVVPLALLCLLAMALPLNLAGWGPREGVAAWAFGVAGFSAAQGVAASVVYGVMVLVASLPGAAVLLVSWLRRVPEPGHA